MNAQTKIEAATLASAMAAAFGEIEAATKASPGQVGKQLYKYADLTSVIEAIKPALIKHGLFFTQRPEPSENGVTVETVIGHASGEEMSLGKLFVPANKNDAQGFGSALTYARRYALVTAFGVPVEDDDGNAASNASARTQSGSGRDTTGDRQMSRTGPAPNAQDWTPAEIAKLIQLIETTGTDRGKMLKHYGVENFRQLSQDQYSAAVKLLSDRLADMAKEETNKAASDFGKDLNDAIVY